MTQNNSVSAAGQEDKLLMTRPDKGYSQVYYPRHINLRGKK